MERVYKIAGKEIKLKAVANNAIIYRSAFGADMFQAQSVFMTLVDSRGNVDWGKVDGLDMMRLVWTMAKSADKNFMPFDDWIDTLDEFPIFDIVNDLIDMLQVNMISITPIKNRKAAGN